MRKLLLPTLIIAVWAGVLIVVILRPPSGVETLAPDRIEKDGGDTAARRDTAETDLDEENHALLEMEQENTAPKVVIAEIAAVAEHLSSSNTSVHEDLEILDALLRYYRRMYVKNPVAGVNEEVVDALTGKNERHLALISPQHPAISPEGRLVDKWGMPYFFHALSGEEMEISSAGPDRKFGTHDDVKLE
jgi:hypothetical protein